MKISVSDAEGQLTDLVRRAEAGDEVILTRHGHAAVRLVPVTLPANRAARRALIEQLGALAADRATPGPDAARGHDDLYDGAGLPG